MRVLFVCTANSCRSQMAEGILRSAGSGKFEAFSAGTKPTSVNPLAIRVMSEAGVDISNHRSKSVEEFAGQRFDYVITMCGDSAEDACPVFTGEARHRLHWNFPDPAAAEGGERDVIAVFKRVRDDIKVKIEKFLEDK